MRAKGISTRILAQRVIDSNVKTLISKMLGASGCATGIQVASVLIICLCRVEAGFESDNLRQLLRSWSGGSLCLSECRIGGLVRQALREVNGFLRNRGEYCFS